MKNPNPPKKTSTVPWHNGMSRAKVVSVATQLEAALMKSQREAAEHRARADKFANTIAGFILAPGADVGERVLSFDELERISRRHVQIEAERTSPADVHVKVVLLGEAEAGKVTPLTS